MPLLITDAAHLEMLFEQTDYYHYTSKNKKSQEVEFLPSTDSGNKTIIVFCQSQSNTLTKAEKDLLAKIFSAVQLDEKQIESNVMAAIDVSEILSEINPEVLLVFDDNQTTDYYTTQINDGVKILTSHSVSTIMNDRDKKMQLWQALKRMFDQ